MYYEPLGTQQPSLQCQISCCLVTHSSDVPTYDWKDTSVSITTKVILHLWNYLNFSFDCCSCSSRLGHRWCPTSPSLCKTSHLISTRFHHHGRTAKVLSDIINPLSFLPLVDQFKTDWSNMSWVTHNHASSISQYELKQFLTYSLN